MRMTNAWMLCGALCLWGCGDDSAAGGAGAGGAGEGGATAGGGGEGGAADNCPVGAHDVDGVCEAELTAWAEGPKLNRGRDHHVTFVSETPAGAFLFVAGGATSSGGPLSAVERSKIGEDGSLSAFEVAPSLPSGLIGPGLGQVDRGVVIAGGLSSSGGSVTTVFVGRVDDDGVIAFEEGPELTVSRYHVGVVAAEGFVYAIGGLGQTTDSPPTQTVEATVERAPFDGETLGPWVVLDPLPQPTTHHSVFAHDGALFILGGGDGLQARTEILRAEIGSGGDLGEWTVVGALPEGRATASTTVFLDHLYVFGGMTSLTGGERDTVLRAPIEAGGEIGDFEELAALPLAKAHCHHTPLHGGFLYSVGGSIHHAGQKESFIGALE